LALAVVSAEPVAAQSPQAPRTQAAANASDDAPVPAVSPWQTYFRRLAGEYRMTAGEDRTKLDLRPEPLLKWSQPVRGGDDGAVFLWTEGGRPAVLGTFFIWPASDGRDAVAHELHVLTGRKVAANWRGEIAWRPPQNALAWQAVPDAMRPAETQAKRMIEARQLARRFTASSKNRQAETYELRLQPRPFFTYESPGAGSDWLGGALFSLVQGTDTEVVLWLEAIKTGSAPTWRYALARMSDLELRVALDGKEVWTTELANYNDTAGPYLSTTPEYLNGPPALANEGR
jgi:hypothetical protein